MTSTQSSPVQRIDDYVKRHLAEARSGESTAAIESARAAAKHGFTACANSRYAAFLEAFRSSPRLAADYAERYPASVFLPWPAFHNVRKALKLSCDVPQHYAGAVPPEQIPWLDLFDFQNEDEALLSDAADLLEFTGDKAIQLAVVIDPSSHREVRDMNSIPSYESYAVMYAMMGFRWSQRDRMGSPDERPIRIRESYQTFQESLFVLAPPEAFTTPKDFITRFREGVEAATRPTVAPNDPLVIRFCKGGCLVVAAWGDEAAELNARVAEIGI